jgi:hypothetical protein
MAQTKQQREQIILVALLVVAACIWYFYFGRAPAVTKGATGQGVYTPIEAQDYTKTFKDLVETQSTVYKSSGRNIFVPGAVQVVAPTATQQAKRQESNRLMVGPQVPPPIPPPVLSMKFFGYGSLPTSGPRRAFLLDGEEVRIVQEGDTLQNHIRITHIGNDRIEYEDINTGKKNSNNLELPPQA